MSPAVVIGALVALALALAVHDWRTRNWVRPPSRNPNGTFKKKSTGRNTWKR